MAKELTNIYSLLIAHVYHSYFIGGETKALRGEVTHLTSHRFFSLGIGDNFPMLFKLVWKLWTQQISLSGTTALATMCFTQLHTDIENQICWNLQYSVC